MKHTKSVRALTLATTLIVAATSAVVGDQLASATPSGQPHTVQAPRLHAVPHSMNLPSKTDTTFVPIAPCRIVDTRHGGGAIHRASTRTFQVTGTSGFPAQGGRSGGCGLPANAKSVSLTVTALNETAAGALTVYPSGVARPLARTLSFSRGAASTAGTNVVIGAGGRVSAYNVSTLGSTDVILDVSGYYEESIEGLVYTAGSTSGGYSGTNRILSVANVTTGVADVTVDQDVTYCTPTVTSYGSGGYASAIAFNGTTIRVFTWYIDTTTHNPVYFNGYVYLTITC